MARRTSSLTNFSVAMSREIGSQYDDVKLVADNILDIQSISAAIADGTLTDAINISNMVVAEGPEGSSPTWDGTTLTIPKGTTGDTGSAGADAPTITNILKTGSIGLVDTYTITLSDASNYTFNVTNGYTPVKNVDYTDGVDGKSAYELWLDAGNTGTLGEFLLDIKGEQGVQGVQGIQGIQGIAGADLTVEQITYNGNGTFTWQFSDSTSYTTPDLTGPQGVKGDTGDKGDTGISVHHLKGTNTTDPEGDFGTFGELDTYTFYGDAGETINLGYFVVRNGITADEVDGLGVMRRVTYDTDGNGIVDNAEALGGKDLATIEAERDAAIVAAQLALGTNYTVADNTAKDALTDLTVGDEIFVTDDGDGKWAQYWVVAITDGQGSTSTFEVVMDEDTYLNANTAFSIKTSYESNPDTNAFTDAEKTSVDIITALTTTASTLPTAINELNAGIANLETTKLDKVGGTITGDLTVAGNFAVQGTTTTVDSTTVTTADNLIIINNGEAGAGVTAGTAGFEVDRGTLTNYQFLFDETTDSFRVGEIGGLQPVATREDAPIDTGIAIWNSTTDSFNTTLTPVISGATVNGNIIITGNVDGRDLSVDGTKLDGIETGATADQLASEVPVTPSGNLSSTNTQAALEELQSDIDTINTIIEW